MGLETPPPPKGLYPRIIQNDTEMVPKGEGGCIFQINCRYCTVVLTILNSNILYIYVARFYYLIFHPLQPINQPKQIIYDGILFTESSSLVMCFVIVIKCIVSIDYLTKTKQSVNYQSLRVFYSLLYYWSDLTAVINAFPLQFTWKATCPFQLFRPYHQQYSREVYTFCCPAIS